MNATQKGPEMKPFAKALAIVGGGAAVLFVGVSLFNTGAKPDAAAVKAGTADTAPAMQIESLGIPCKNFYAAYTDPGHAATPTNLNLKSLEAFKGLDGDVVTFGKKSPEPGDADYAARLKEYINTERRAGCHVANTITWADDASTTAADSMGKIVPPPAPPEPAKVDYSWTMNQGGNEVRYLNKSKLWVEIRRKDPITDDEIVQTCGTELTGALEDQMNKSKGIKTARSHRNLCWGGANKNIIFNGAGERPLYAPSYGAAQVDVKFEMPDATNVVKHYTAFIATDFSALVLQCGNGDCESTDFVSMARAANQFTIRFKNADGGDIVQMYSSAAFDPSLKPKTAPAPVEVKRPPPQEKSAAAKVERETEIHGKVTFNVADGSSLGAILGQETLKHIVSFVNRYGETTVVSDIPCVSHNERAAGMTSFKMFGGSSTAYRGCAYTSANGEFLLDYAEVGRAPDNNIAASELTPLPDAYR